MSVTFRQLKLFLALTETRSITGVARKMHVSQPTVSMQLRELAESVGLPLYEIISKRLALTAAGEELAISARAMVNEWSAFEERIGEMQGLTRGQLRISVVSTAKYFIPRLLGAFCRKYPEIEVSLEVLNREGVVNRLRGNLDDCYVMSMPPTDLELEKRIFMANPLVVIAPSGHRLAQQTRLELRQLIQERFILRERGSGTRLACDAFFSAHDFKPTVRLELGSNEAIKQSVAGGMGLSVISVHALSEHYDAEALNVLNVDGFPIQSNWYSVTPLGKRLSPPASAFLEYLKAHAMDVESHKTVPPQVFESESKR